jgi:hypothetical protein
LTPGNCFTVTYDEISQILESDVRIAAVGSAAGADELVNSPAIWDTGAMSTVIRPEVAARLELKTVSLTRISTPSGTKECKQYFVNLQLPNRIIVSNLLVAEAVPANCDVLIGMDIINFGDFAVSNFEGKTSFTFRMPSMQHIDFLRRGHLS